MTHVFTVMYDSRPTILLTHHLRKLGASTENLSVSLLNLLRISKNSTSANSLNCFFAIDGAIFCDVSQMYYIVISFKRYCWCPSWFSFSLPIFYLAIVHDDIYIVTCVHVNIFFYVTMFNILILCILV